MGDKRWNVWTVEAFCLCFTSRRAFSLNLVPLYTTYVQLNTVSVSDISAVNLILGGCKFHWSLLVRRKLRYLIYVRTTDLCSVSKLLVQRLFCLLRICVSIYAMKMLAKETAVSWAHRGAGVCRWCFPLNWREFSLRINLSISRR